MASASDISYKADLLLNGELYMFAAQEDVEASFGYTPTFVPRQNVQGAYGDNFQDWWLTFSQNDWSLGEQQRFFRGDEEGRRRYWRGTKLDVLTPGQVTLRQEGTELTFAESVVSCAAAVNRAANSIYLGGTANLRSVNYLGTLSDHGAHGLGAAPSQFGMTSDGTDIYMTTTSGGTVGVRKWNGAAFSTFSATAANTLEYLNNALYGAVNSSGVLQRYDTAGTATTVYTWKQADGDGFGTTFKPLRSFGGKLLIVVRGARAWELWLYDGSSPSKVDEMPSNFEAEGVEVLNGTVFLSGYYVRADDKRQPTVRYWANGTPGELWRATDYATDSYAIGLTTWDGKLVFQVDSIPGSGTGTLIAYDPINGGVHSFAQYTSSAGNWRLYAATAKMFVQVRASATGFLFPSSTVASSGTVTSSLVDFDSSLTKVGRGIKVDWEHVSGETGATVDIAYRVGDVDGSYTSLQAGATSGTEYNLSGVTGRSISVRVTLNKGSSTSGPVLKRVYVRAAPLQQTFKRRTYVLNCTGKDGESHVLFNDGSEHPKDGKQQVTDLQTAATATTPFSVTDELGTTANVLIEPDGFKIHRVRPEEYIVQVTCREV